MKYHYLALFYCCLSFHLYAVGQDKLQITIEADTYNQAQALLGPRSPATIENFSHPECQRDIVDFILVQKALSLGGFKRKFEFHLGNFDARNIKLLINGLLLVSFDTIWLSHAIQHQKTVFISAPVIRKGEYWAGIYSSKKNSSRIKLNNLKDLKALSIVSSKDWYVDWLTLTNINPKKLIHEPDWISMAKLVSMGWVDVMLAPFNNQFPFQFKGDNYHIVAIDGVKLALDDSRHFVVSRAHPQGYEAFEALEKGLTELRKLGTIERAYRQCGFFNPRVENWILLNR